MTICFSRYGMKDTATTYLVSGGTLLQLLDAWGDHTGLGLDVRWNKRWDKRTGRYTWESQRVPWHVTM